MTTRITGKTGTAARRRQIRDIRVRRHQRSELVPKIAVALSIPEAQVRRVLEYRPRA